MITCQYCHTSWEGELDSLVGYIQCPFCGEISEGVKKE